MACPAFVLAGELNWNHLRLNWSHYHPQASQFLKGKLWGCSPTGSQEEEGRVPAEKRAAPNTCLEREDHWKVLLTEEDASQMSRVHIRMTQENADFPVLVALVRLVSRSTTFGQCGLKARVSVCELESRGKWEDCQVRKTILSLPCVLLL